MRILPPLVAATALVVCSAAYAEPIRGTVVMRDGRRFDAVLYEVRGKSVWVKFEWGAATFSLGDVAQLVPGGGGGGGGEGEEEQEEAGPSGRDWEARFALEPPKGWEAIEPRRPLERAVLRREDDDTTLSVSVRPAEGGPWQLSTDARFRAPREVGEAFEADLQAAYAKVTRPKVEVGTLYGAPVYRLSNVAVTEYGADKNDTRVLTELRFRRFGLEYALTLSLRKDAQELASEELGRIQRAFTFLEPVSLDDERYSDFERGFAIERPNGDWDLQAHPFSETRPLMMTTAGGRGEVTVRVIADTNADGVVQKLMRSHRERSRHFSKDSITAEKQDGSPVVRFSFEDFREGGRKKLLYQGFAAAIHGNVLLFQGVSALSDPDSRKIEQDVNAILSSVRLQDLDRLSNDILQQKAALSSLAQGHTALEKRSYGEALQHLEAAIQGSPRFAMAYYLRGQAKKGQQDFEGYRADLEQADQLDPGASYAKELAKSYEYEAQAAQSRKEWGAALDLWERCYRSSKDEKLVRNITSCASQLWNESKRAKDYVKGAKELERRLKSVRKEAGVAEFLAKTYSDAAASLARENNFSAAKTCARSAKRIARYVSDSKLEATTDKLFDTLKAQEQKYKDSRR